MSPEIRLLYVNILKHRIWPRFFRDRNNHNCFKVQFYHASLGISDRTAVYLGPKDISQSKMANLGDWEELTWTL